MNSRLICERSSGRLVELLAGGGGTGRLARAVGDCPDQAGAAAGQADGAGGGGGGATAETATRGKADESERGPDPQPHPNLRPGRGGRGPRLRLSDLKI